MDKDGNFVEGNIGDKTAQCCKNLGAVLKAAGSDISKVVKVPLDPSAATVQAELI